MCIFRPRHRTSSSPFLSVSSDVTTRPSVTQLSLAPSVEQAVIHTCSPLLPFTVRWHHCPLFFVPDTSARTTLNLRHACVNPACVFLSLPLFTLSVLSLSPSRPLPQLDGFAQGFFLLKGSFSLPVCLPGGLGSGFLTL